MEERPDVPFGSTGADARISAVSDAATGAPTALGNARDSIIVMATFARGPAWSSTESLEVKLVLTGACPGIVVAAFPAPAPVVIAHQFRITASDIAAWCTRDGVTLARAVLLGRNARPLAASVPMGLTIRR